MPRSKVVKRTTRFAAIAALTAALTLAPSLFRSSGDIATAKEQATCNDKFQSCMNRCWGAAEKSSPDVVKQTDYLERCQARTCNAVRNRCEAASKGKSQKVEKATATGSPQTTPRQPLTPQKVTRSPTTVPTQSVTTQKVTSSPKTAPTQPLTTSGSSRRGNR
jgi:hypothetical protein